MPDLDFLIHMPLLRIEEELLPFGPGRLYRAPFAKYDEITFGAFREQRKKYEVTEPVFLALSVAVPEQGLERRLDEVKGMIELKAPSARRGLLDDIGLHAVNWAHEHVAIPAWTALLLAAPASALAPPTWSQTFVSIDGGFTLSVASRPTVGARVQGEADHEYLFLPDAVSDRMPTANVARASSLIDSVRAWEAVPELRTALMILRATGSPLLSRQDRLTLAVRALESLLLPEIQTMLKRTFSRRVSALLANDSASVEMLATIAGDLYSLRSESVHGAALPDSHAALEAAFAEQMLAMAIQAVGARLSTGQPLEKIRQGLDEGLTDSGPAHRLQLQRVPVSRAADDRLARLAPSDVYVPTSRMVAGENRVCCWSPLIGLTTEGFEESGGMPLGQQPAPVVMPLTPEELYDLEERDIRRDFLAGFIQQGHAMAVLMTVPDGDETPDGVSATPRLERMRDLGVVALRLAGFARFHDPELFGSAVFEGARRLRRPTVLRQTIAEQLRHEAVQRIGPSDQRRIASLWSTIWRYEVRGRSPQIEHALGLFRRSFDRDFLHPEQRAVVLLSLLEGMLGRFRPRNDRVQLEDLVTALHGDVEPARWFRDHGRAFRNEVAHGRFQSEQSADTLEKLSSLVSGIVLALVETWTAAEDTESARRPSEVLLTHATALHDAGRRPG